MEITYPTRIIPIIVAMMTAMATAGLGQDNLTEMDKQLERLVRSLERTSQQMAQLEERRVKHTENIVLHQMSPQVVIAQNNSLPNYFLYRQEVSNGKSRSSSTNPHSMEIVNSKDKPQGFKKASDYQQGAIVFLHHPRAVGSAVIKCMDGIAHQKSLASSAVMDSDERLIWEYQGGPSPDNQVKHQRDRLSFHRGKFTFGMCNGLQKQCSHFTVLREPMSRAISSYEYCKTAYGDEMCRMADANKITLREWILHQGSVLFQQLLFQPDWCHLGAYNKTKAAGASQEHKDQFLEHLQMSIEDHRKYLADPDHVPCWYKNKEILQETLTAQTHRHLVDYVVTNLGKWFAVVGLYEELGHSLSMLEHVYGIPFTQCEDFKKSMNSENQRAQAEIFDNRSNRKKRRRYQEDKMDNDPEYLRYDYEVQKVLEADFKIYKEAQKLFRVQKQSLFNKIGRR